jgi:hypothetical protein
LIFWYSQTMNQSNNFSIDVCVFVAIGAYVLSCSLATAVSSDSSILALSHCITLNSKVVACDVFCAVHIITVLKT